MGVRFLLFFALLFTSFLRSNAQDSIEVQWVSHIIEASSELSPREFSAQQIIGKPNVMPGSSESPNAWMARKEDQEDYVKVGFAKPMRIRQIAIAESANPSAVYQLYLYDRADNEFLINTFNPRYIDLEGRMLLIFFDQTDYEVAALKVVIRGDMVPGFNAIDAIGISNSTVPIRNEVLIADIDIVNVNPERLSETVNSIYNELKPIITPDGKTLLFSRQFHPGNIGGATDPEDIWFSRWDEEKGEWREAENMGEPLNTKGPNYISSITPDGNTVIITLGNEYKRGGKMKAGVSVSTRTSEGWTKPVPFEIIKDVNTSDVANYYLANNREVLLMSIEGDPSFGDRDIYVSFLQDDGRWSEPLNLGSNINTSLTEDSPFLAADDKTLYFSSNGYIGYGGMDIYISRRLDDTWTNWSEPQNLGPLINSPRRDAFFNIPPTGEYGYFSREYEKENSDIYRFELPKEHQPEAVVTIRGIVFNAKTKQPCEARIVYEILPAGSEIGHIESDPVTGEYQIILPAGKMYGYLAEADGFVSVNANINLEDMKEYGELRKDLYLVPIEKGAVVQLNNIFFDFDMTDLNQESHPELKRVVDMMKNNPEIRISVEGHTDNIGTVAYNKELSELRAKAVVEYLVKQGIDESRLEAVGWGKAKPLVRSSDDEERESNRRVEFKIIED